MRIHFIAIGGSIMHSLALVMHQRGHVVTGSDDEIYEPSRSRLDDAGLLPETMGWYPGRIHKDLDIVVLGMHARGDNPELIQALALGLKVESFPEFMFNLSKEKTRVVVAGSHGKTTTSGMLAHLFHKSGIPADRMIGAKIGPLEPVAISDAGLIVLEGDEYLSSPLDQRPKFLHYHPHITIITGIAWDHMNVFPTYASYVDQFRQLIESLQSGDKLIYCSEDKDLVELVSGLNPACDCIPYTAHDYRIENHKVVIRDEDGQDFALEIFGNHNLQNLKAAQWASSFLGVDADKFYSAIQSFTGANKRLQLLHQADGLTAYLDFAHAPSKVKATVNAVREKHPDAYIIACLELHTFSSLNPEFLPQYRDALKEADVKIVYYSPHTLEIKKLPDLSAEQLSGYFNEPALQIATSKEELEKLIFNSKKDTKTVLLWMSSGRFDGLDINRASLMYMNKLS
jgi:UDP-N-acetylmuramate: L-alanyl-gamma-D-glutamyl-meso-diaminopimelate ligase